MAWGVVRFHFWAIFVERASNKICLFDCDDGGCGLSILSFVLSLVNSCADNALESKLDVISWCVLIIRASLNCVPMTITYINAAPIRKSDRGVTGLTWAKGGVALRLIGLVMVFVTTFVTLF